MHHQGRKGRGRAVDVVVLLPQSMAVAAGILCGTPTRHERTDELSAALPEITPNMVNRGHAKIATELVTYK